MPEEKSWKPLELIKVTAGYLAGKKVPNPRLDAEILLCGVLGLERRVDLYAGFERDVSGGELAAYREFIRRRSGREPVSRILGRREFMGIDFIVTPDVLSPRPETELLVEEILAAVNPRTEKAVPSAPEEPPPEEAPELVPEELERLLDSYAEDVDDEADVDAEAPAAAGRPAARARAASRPETGKPAPADAAGRGARILDLGCGSGCIAVALAAKLPGAAVVAVDASPKALAVARKNAARAGVAPRVDFRQGDWFAGCREGEAFDFIVSNPPYLVEGDPDIWPEVSRFDPPAALYGGRDGLDCYRRIVPDAPERLRPGGRIFLEVGAGQAGKVADLLRRRGFVRVETVSDYGGVERVVRGVRGADGEI